MNVTALKGYLLYTYKKSGIEVNSHDRWSSLLLLFLSGLYSSALVVFFHLVNLPVAGNTFVFLALAAGLIYWYLHSSANLYISAHLYGLATTLGFGFMIANTGGLHSPLLIYLLIPSVGTTLISTKRAGVVWTVVSLVFALLLVLAHYYSLPFLHSEVPANGVLSIVAFLSLLMYFLNVMWTYEKGKNAFLEVIKEQNGELLKKNDVMELQKTALEKVNSNIYSSIRYANKIQEAVMHHGCSLKTLFPETFVFLKPRDIVSGDFYWTQQIGDRKMVVAADCTGHGVPGAFMSLIGMYLLHSIVQDSKKFSPDEILGELRSSIHHFLNQETSESRDGMDIAICVCSEETLWIASAKSTVYYLQQGELKSFKGDNLPIGGNKKIKKEERYSLLALPRKEIDYVYMCSDGYQDQFGGDEHKKFMKKRMMELLYQLSALPAHQKEEALKEQFLRWKGKQAQVDDVLVLGFSPAH